ncbi:peroxiredoxin [Pycnococcus provasolii]
MSFLSWRALATVLRGGGLGLGCGAASGAALGSRVGALDGGLGAASTIQMVVRRYEDYLANVRPPAPPPADAGAGFHAYRLAEYGYTLPPAFAAVGRPAPDFNAGAVMPNGEIDKLKLSDYKGKWVLLFFYPKDFTFVCPTEIIAFSEAADKFREHNAEIIGCSTDTEETHLAWIRTSRKRGGLGEMNIPLVADVTKDIAAQYGTLSNEIGIAFRGTFIINPDGVIESTSVLNFPVGRSVEEQLRLIQALQFVAEHGEVCPVGWKPGDKTMIPTTDGSVEYFASGATEQLGTSAEKEDDDEDFASFMPSMSSPSELEATISGNPKVVVEYMASWCGKCRQIAGFVKGLKEKYERDVKFVKVDTSDPEWDAYAKERGVHALPAFRFYAGGKESGSEVSGYKKKSLGEAVERLVHEE